jgi:sulfate adenylyltransferase subunit 2
VSLSHLRSIEAEAIHILRETAAQFTKPVLLYSIGKDSSVLLHLARKAFYPALVPFPLLHVDTTYEYPEMIEFRDRFTKEIGAQLLVYTNDAAIADGANPYSLGTSKCCGLLRTKALVDGLKHYGFDAALGGGRRDEEKSRAKERVFSFRDKNGHWDPKNQRPELWNIYNGKVDKGESIRVFPLSNWTEFDIWAYMESNVKLLPGEEPKMVKVRMRSLGCTPCSGAIRSDADTVAKIIEELFVFRRSERENRVIDHDQDGSMELKKREGYF